MSDVYIGLICEGYDDKKRIESIINNQATQTLLWTYKSKKSNDINLSSELFKLGNYPDIFESPEDLSHQFDNKLYRKLVEWFPNSNNRFTIEDHVLIRYSSSSGIKHILFNLWDNYVANTDNYELRESIISDVLNQYCLTGQFNKLAIAINEIRKGNYSYFTDWDRIPECNDNISNIKETQLLKIFHTIELLIESQKDGITDDKVSEHICRCSESIKDFKLSPHEFFVLYYLYGKLLSYHSNLCDSACDYLEQALLYYYNDSDANHYWTIAYAKMAVLLLCEMYYKEDKYDKLYSVLVSGERLCVYEDPCYKARLMEYKALCLYYHCVHNREEEVAKVYEIACETLKPYQDKDNECLRLYIILKVSSIINNRKMYNNDVIAEELSRLHIDFKNKYNRRLSSSCSHADNEVATYLLLLKGIIHYSPEICHDAKIKLADIYQWREDDEILLDLDYLEYDVQSDDRTAILGLSRLASLYKGDLSKGICLQNIALRYMANYQEVDSLLFAENAYSEAGRYFISCGNRQYLGNIYDGLSYCYILQKKPSLAIEFSKKSISISEYDTPKKFCNMISSLLCTGKWIKAAITYYSISIKDRHVVKQTLSEDWSKEMKEKKYNTKYFSLIFGVDKYLLEIFK